MNIDSNLKPADLSANLTRLFDLAAEKVRLIDKSWDSSKGTPVFTVEGKYTSRGWTEWTQGFQFGSALLQFDATGDEQFLEIGKRKTFELMATHVSHVGVHDHGFNNVSTYGNIWRLLRERRIEQDEWLNNFCEIALKVSGAVQAARWTEARLGPE